MFGPLSLRLCSLAVMAPALTETASQARVSLSPSPPESGLESRVKGKDDFMKEANDIEYLVKQPSIESLTGKTVQNRNFFFASTQLTQLSSLNSLPELFKAKNCNIKSDFVNGRMNNSSTTNGKMVSDVDSYAAKLSNGSVTQSDNINNKETGNGPHVTSKDVGDLNLTEKDSSSDSTNLNPEGKISVDTQIEPNDDLNVGSLPLTPLVGVDSVRRQQTLEIRAGRLAKRIRRLQSVQSTSHVRSQLQGFVDSQHKNLESMATSIKVSPSVDLKPDVLQSEDIKNLSTAALVNLVRRLQSSQVTLRQRLQSSSQAEGTSVLTLDEDTASDVEHVAGKLRTSLAHLEKDIDSDATESSSGGESCDEDDYSDTENKYSPPLHKRAEWKWASNRSCVASRWTWLQAQVSDLEYRIRQQTEIYKQIRQTKGQVVLGEQPTPEDLMARLRPSRIGGRKMSPIEAKISAIEKRNEMSPCNISSLLHNVDKQSSKLTQSLGNCYSPLSTNVSRPNSAKTSPVVNGALDSSQGSLSSVDSSVDNDIEDPLHKKARLDELNSEINSSGSKNSVDLSPPADSTCRAARCRPVRIYRKRKLLRTTGLHLVNRKAARLSTVKCHCYPPSTSCPMCGGRYNNAQEVDPFSMTTNDRTGLLDPSFHPILSFKQDIPLTIHFESLLKTGDWQNKPALKSSKNSAVSVDKKKTKAKSDTPSSIKKSKKNNTALLSSKLRRGLSRSHGSSLPGTPKISARDTRLCRTDVKKKKKSSRLSHSMSSKKPHRTKSVPNHMDRSFSTPSPSFRDTPTPPVTQSCPSAMLKAELKAAMLKKRESAFDINNIVIPYSMAASTRVEKLQYKEILTPKWRDVTLPLEETSDTVQDDIKHFPSPESLPSDNITTKPEPNLKTVKTEPDEEVKEPEKDTPPTVAAAVSTDGKSTEVIGESTTPMETTNSSCNLGEDDRKDSEPVVPPNGLLKVSIKEEPMEADDEYDDLCDEAIAARHLKCEIQEKKRFMNFVTITNKRGSRRTESGATTPDPMSPEASLNDSLFRSLNVSSPTPPSTPAFGKDSSLRKRSGSMSRRGSEVERLSISEDSMTGGIIFDVPCAVPWPARNFPLSEEDNEDLYCEKPAKMEPLVLAKPTNALHSYGDVVQPSLPSSPLSSVSDVEDDPNDPEWTCVAQEKTGAMPKIVLKLKR